MVKTTIIKNPVEEQETTINVDYFSQTIDIYTSRPEVYKVLVKKVGKPDKNSFVKGKAVGGYWRIPFSEREKIRKILSIKNMDI